MQEHPIPQDITGYKFHIIGSMTLKQFGEIFLGVIIAAILWKTNLIAIIKWPLILMSVGLGAAAAFLPIEERPLDHWIITFFRVLYKPTKFFWKKEARIPESFTYVANVQKNENQLIDLTPAKRQRIKEYVGSIPELNSNNQDLTSSELSRINDILNSFETININNVKTNKVEPKKEKPRIDVRVRKMRKPITQEKIIFSTPENSPIQKTNTVENILKNESKKVVLKTNQVANDIEVPEEQIIRATAQESIVEDINENNNNINDTSEKSYITPQVAQSSPVLNYQEANYNKDLPFPIQPTEPNKVVGMVLSQNNEILANAIVEIQTLDGAIVRAVKTNSLGQFFVTTPLKIGEYNLVVEKSGYQFQPQHLKIDNSIVLPMEIRSEN